MSVSICDRDGYKVGEVSSTSIYDRDGYKVGEISSTAEFDGDVPYKVRGISFWCYVFSYVVAGLVFLAALGFLCLVLEIGLIYAVVIATVAIVIIVLTFLFIRKLISIRNERKKIERFAKQTTKHDTSDTASKFGEKRPEAQIWWMCACGTKNSTNSGYCKTCGKYRNLLRVRRYMVEQRQTSIAETDGVTWLCECGTRTSVNYGQCKQCGRYRAAEIERK